MNRQSYTVSDQLNLFVDSVALVIYVCRPMYVSQQNVNRINSMQSSITQRVIKR